MLAFLHLLRSLIPPGGAAPNLKVQRTLDILWDGAYISLDHFIKKAEQSLVSWRAIAIQAVNLVDGRSLLQAPLVTDLFWWSVAKAADMEIAYCERKLRRLSFATLFPRGRGSWYRWYRYIKTVTS